MIFFLLNVSSRRRLLKNENKIKYNKNDISRAENFTHNCGSIFRRELTSKARRRVASLLSLGGISTRAAPPRERFLCSMCVCRSRTEKFADKIRIRDRHVVYFFSSSSLPWGKGWRDGHAWDFVDFDGVRDKRGGSESCEFVMCENRLLLGGSPFLIVRDRCMPLLASRSCSKSSHSNGYHC